MFELLKYQNFFQHCSLCLNFLHNYFDSLTKLFLDLYLTIINFLFEQNSFRCIIIIIVLVIKLLTT